MAYNSIDPYSGKKLGSFEERAPGQLESTVQAAQRCFEQDWRGRNLGEHAAVVKLAAALMRERVR